MSGRTDMMINSDLVHVVGSKAINDGFNIRQPELISTFITKIMRQHASGKFDDALESLQPVDLNPPTHTTHFSVRLTVKRESQTKAFNDGHILKHHKHNRFVEKLMRMYLKDEIKIK